MNEFVIMLLHVEKLTNCRSHGTTKKLNTKHWFEIKLLDITEKNLSRSDVNYLLLIYVSTSS